MKYSIFLLICTVLLSSCKDDGNSYDSIPLGDRQFAFSMIDSENEDLLNPEIQGTYNTDQIKLYYLVEGEKEEVYEANLKYPRAYNIDAVDGMFYINIFANFNDEDEWPVTFIEWNGDDADTVKCEFSKENVKIIKKTWYNDELVWNWEMPVPDDVRPIYFNVVK